MNGEELQNTIMSNKTIIDLALEYTQSKKDKNNILNAINHVRLYKQVYLPFELLGMNRTTQTKCYDNIYKKS